MSGRGTDSKPAERRSPETRSVSSSVPDGVPAQVEDARHRVAALDDDAWLEMLGRQHHGHRIGAGEPAQRGRLVGDAVLGADHGRGRGRVLDQVGQRVLGLVRLHGEQDDRVVEPGDLTGAGRGPHGERLRPVRRVEHQPGSPDPRQVLTASDERDVVAGQVQPAPDHGTDGAGAVDDVGRHRDSGRLRRQTT